VTATYALQTLDQLRAGRGVGDVGYEIDRLRHELQQAAAR
jgi:hypothetical protein